MMNIGLVLTNGEKLTLEVEPEMQGAEIVEQLLESQVILPLNDPKQHYQLYKKVTVGDNVQLNHNMSLADSGVNENDNLMISVEGVA